MRLTSLDAVLEAHLHLEMSSAGWAVWVRHRHLGGLMTDCPASSYDSLTVEELADLLAALVFSWPAPATDGRGRVHLG
jgi:hypothetical protein